MKEKILEELNNNGFYLSRMISGSKTVYRSVNPNNLVFFNANIFIEEEGKIWYGDIDLTKDHKKFLEISKKINAHLYILSEHDGRFGNEDRTDFKSVSVWNTENGLSEEWKEYYDEKKLKSKKIT